MKVDYSPGTLLQEIADAVRKDGEERFLLAKCGGELRELTHTLEEDCDVEFLTGGDKPGYQTLERSTVFLMLKAFRDVVGKRSTSRIIVDFSAGGGLFCRVNGNIQLSQELLDRIAARMRELSDMALPLEKNSYRTEDAIALFRKSGMHGKERLFRFRRSSRVNVYRLDDYEDYFYGYMVPDTSYIRLFSLDLYEQGFILRIPPMRHPDHLSDIAVSKKVFDSLYSTTVKAEKMDLADVGGLNACVAEGRTRDLILSCEALMEKQIGDIAQKIYERGDIRFVMIAGPSSSGKTTFSNRLCTQLRALGMKPHPIEVDNYFVPRLQTPRDENGEFDYECLEAMDVELFNEDMTKLMKGETVKMPTYNFLTGEREYRGNKLKVGKGEILVIEGIHCLNERFSYALPAKSKLKIYISCLTQMNVDEHNRIPTTDARLLRRITRDARVRGNSAQVTLQRWPSVGRGEQKYIFPYQESADIVFNSAVIYETAVLKPYAEALLFGVPRDSNEYIEAKRLLKFLDYFLTIPADDIPETSIVREFIGGGVYKV